VITVLWIIAGLIYGCTAAVIGATIRTSLLARAESNWSAGAAWVAGWALGLLWLPLVLIAALVLLKRAVWG
jgi:hypothetical protein